MHSTLMAPAYPYQQFSDDTDINALFSATNEIAQSVLTWMLDHPLALYMRPALSGGLLDYAAYCLYGIARHQVGYSQITNIAGAINTMPVNTLDIDDNQLPRTSMRFTLTDDIFKRILTWHLYKGDGVQFSIPWLKRRIMRFLSGDDGHAWRFNSTAPVSIAIHESTVAISIAKGTADERLLLLLSALIKNGLVPVPPTFSYSFSEH